MTKIDVSSRQANGFLINFVSWNIKSLNHPVKWTKVSIHYSIVSTIFCNFKTFKSNQNALILAKILT